MNPTKQKLYWDNQYERNKNDIIKKDTIRRVNNIIEEIEADLKHKLGINGYKYY